MNIAFYQYQALGDLITSLPALSALRATNPTAKIHGHVPFDRCDFLKQTGFVDDCAWGGLMLSDRSPIPAYDLSVWCGPVARSNPGRSVSAPIDPNGQIPPGLQRLKNLQAALGLPVSGSAVPVVPNVQPNPAFNGFVAVHANGGLGKSWRFDRWTGVCKGLVDRGHTLLLIQGRWDFNQGIRLQQALPSGKTVLLSDASLFKVSQALKACKLLVGGETGISHLSAALGVSTIALWNQRYAPWVPASASAVFHPDGGINNVTVEAVLSKV